MENENQSTSKKNDALVEKFLKDHGTIFSPFGDDRGPIQQPRKEYKISNFGLLDEPGTVPILPLRDVPAGTDIKTVGLIKKLRIYESDEYIAPEIIDDIVPLYLGTPERRNTLLNDLERATYIFLSIENENKVLTHYRILSDDRMGEQLGYTMGLVATLKDYFLNNKKITLFGEITTFPVEFTGLQRLAAVKFLALKLVELS